MKTIISLETMETIYVLQSKYYKNISFCKSRSIKNIVLLKILKIMYVLQVKFIKNLDNQECYTNITL